MCTGHSAPCSTCTNADKSNDREVMVVEIL